MKKLQGVLWLILTAWLQPATLLCSQKGDYRVCQVPHGNVTSLSGPKTKIIFSVSSNSTDFKSNIKLRARINDNTVMSEHRKVGDQFAVIYNSCGDSDEPALFCKEAQVTLSQNEIFTSVSFHLFEGMKRLQSLSTISLKRLSTEVPPNITTTDDILTPTDYIKPDRPDSVNNSQAPPNITTTDDVLTTTDDIKPESTDTVYSQGLPYHVGVVACAVAGVFILLTIALLVALVVTCTCKTRNSRTHNSINKDPEEQPGDTAKRIN